MNRKEIEDGLEIFNEQSVLSKGTWEKFKCPKCKAENWFNWDVDYAEVCICYVCRKEFWIDSNSSDEYEGNMNLSKKQKGKNIKDFQ